MYNLNVPMLAYLLAIAATFLYGVTNFIDKFLIEKKVRDGEFLAMISGVVSFVFGIGVLSLNRWPTVGLAPTVILLTSGVLFQLALLPWYKAIDLDDPSRVAALFQAIPIFTFIFAYFLLGEQLSWHQAAGFVLIIAGGFILSLRKFSGDIFKIRKSTKYMLLAVILNAIPPVLFKAVTPESDFWIMSGYEFIGMGIGSALTYFYVVQRRPHLRHLLRSLENVRREALAFITVNEAVYFSANILFFAAVTMAPVSLISAMGGFQPFFMIAMGLILARWFPKMVKEDISRKTLKTKIGAALLIFLGVWIINI